MKPGQLSENFTRAEFTCRCGCGFDTVDAELVEVLQGLRDHFGTAVTITSGCRCEAHNREVDGSKRSQHVQGRAADVTVLGAFPETVQGYLAGKYPDRYGLGRYKTFTHIDTRSGPPARW